MARLKKYPKDPTKSKKWEKKFEREIGKLIRRFKIELITSFNLAWNAGIIRNLESGKIDPSKFYKYVDDLAEKEIHKPAKKAAEKIIPKAYDQGVTFGSVVLGAPPEERFRIWGHLKFQLENTKTEFKGHSDDTTRRIKRIIGDGVQNERTQSQIIGNIQEEVKICENNAIRIARTEVQRAVNIGVKDRYVKEGVEYVKWLAAGDDRVCPQCESLDGKIFEINHAPQPPIHPNCRCTLIAAINPDRSKIEKWDDTKQPSKEKTVAPDNKLDNYKIDLNDPESEKIMLSIMEDEEYEYYGLRSLSDNPKSGKVADLHIGDTAPNSYEWIDDVPTDNELPGVSAVKITPNTFKNENWRFKIYSGDRLVFLGADDMQYGPDADEIIMKKAKVLATFKR